MEIFQAKAPKCGQICEVYLGRAIAQSAIGSARGRDPADSFSESMFDQFKYDDSLALIRRITRIQGTTTIQQSSRHDYR